MTSELAKQLKDAGFPQNGRGWLFLEIEGEDEPDEVFGMVTFPQIETKNPTLSELIEACGDGFHELHYHPTENKGRIGNEKIWWVSGYLQHNKNEAYGQTPEEAVAKLWVSLNKK